MQAIPLLVGLATIIFFLSRLLPGDPTLVFLSPSISPERLEQLRIQFGLDKPLAGQYIAWLGAAFSGDLGMSFSYNEPVTKVIGRFFPNTVILASAALFLEVLLGTALAMPAFFRHGGALDRFVGRSLVLIYTLPSFWIGMLLLMIFSYQLGWLPSSQMYSSGTMAGEGTLGDLLSHLVLPAMTAAIPAAAGFGRYLRSSIGTVLGQEYVTAARSMGLTERKIFRSYVLPNALSPMVALIGIEIGLLLTGVLVTETLFAWPGMGRVTVLAIASRDYPLILGCTLLAGVVVILGNLVADVINAAIDPRVRAAEAR